MRSTLVMGLLGAMSVCVYGLHAYGQETAAVDVTHGKVYFEPGRFGGWPANHGVWSWGNEILVGYSRGFYKDLGSERHNIDRERPEEHWLARSLDGGLTWSHEHPMTEAKAGGRKSCCLAMVPIATSVILEWCRDLMKRWW